MRPPSYYTSLANSNAYNNRNSNQQLRSSFSSSSSSSYVSRTHLPFVPQSTLVAHCFTGVGSSTRPYGQAGGYSTSKSYTTSYSSRPQSTKRNPYLSTSNTNYSTNNSYLSSSSSISSTPRSTYISSGSIKSIGSSSSYSRPNFSSSSYYKPIRLRERPLLTQISRQLNTATTTTNSSSRLPPIATPHQVHSSTKFNDNRAEKDDDKQPTRKLDVDESPTRTQTTTKDEDEEVNRTKKETEEDEANWSSDVARNISRNKYLIKFREFDKRPSSAGAQIIDDSPISIEQPEVEKSNSDEMRIPIQAKTDQLVSSDNEPVLKKEQSSAEVSEVKCDTSVKSTTTDSVQVPPAEVKKQVNGEKKVPKEKRNIKLKLKTQIKSDQSQNQGQPTTTTSIVKKNKDSVSATSGEPQAKPDSSPTDAPATTKVKVKRIVKTSKTKAKNNEKVSTPPKATSDEPKLSEQPERKVLVVKQEKVEDVDKEKSNKPVDLEKQHQSLSGNSTPGTASSNANKRIRFREYHIEDFNFLSVLGHGGWGFVILAELKDYDACFAVKCIKKITIVEDDDFDSIMIERKVLSLGNVHPFICKLFCTFETEGYLFFVMEYCAGGDLMFHVQKEGKFTEPRSRFYASEIICAIRFLHNRHIIYRDLKLDNILLDSKGHIRLVDFGMCQCRTYREEMLPSNFCGTPEYISPEIIKGVPYNHSVDWWSFGVLLYEMAVGKMPFRGNDENELLWNVCYEQIHYPMFLTKELTTLLQSLLEREPTKRMGMASCKSGDIYDHAWFRGVDWAAVEELRVKPPFVPEVRSKRDVQNFDSDFTESAPELSPVDSATLKRIDQSQFQKFPYTNPNIAVFE